MFTVFTDGAALLRLVHGVDTLRDGAVGHHAVHLIIWFAAAPLTGGRLWTEGGGAQKQGIQVSSFGRFHLYERLSYDWPVEEKTCSLYRCFHFSLLPSLLELAKSRSSNTFFSNRLHSITLQSAAIRKSL